ncbi:MAG: hypothetical protein IIV90_05615, partial [Oscillospiraceae bacterium]|nr:hypothetical protein [Oscillospiraceae bacterium]
MSKTTATTEAPKNALPAVRKVQKNPYSLTRAITKGGVVAWLSMLIMGFGNLCAGQFVKGLLFLAIEALFVGYMMSPEGGIHYLKLLPSLGDREMIEYWDEEEFVYKYIMGDDSKLILLYGVVAVCVIALMIVVWRASVCSGFKALSLRRRKEKVPNIIDDIKSLFDANVHKLLMFLPVALLAVFTVVPLVYMMTMAFTDYNKTNYVL